MEFKINIDLGDLETDDSGTTLNDWIKEIVKSDITRILKKSPEYKMFISQKAQTAIDNLEIEL